MMTSNTSVIFCDETNAFCNKDGHALGSSLLTDSLGRKVITIDLSIMTGPIVIYSDHRYTVAHINGPHNPVRRSKISGRVLTERSKIKVVDFKKLLADLGLPSDLSTLYSEHFPEYNDFLCSHDTAKALSEIYTRLSSVSPKETETDTIFRCTDQLLAKLVVEGDNESVKNVLEIRHQLRLLKLNKELNKHRQVLDSIYTLNNMEKSAFTSSFFNDEHMPGCPYEHEHMPGYEHGGDEYSDEDEDDYPEPNFFEPRPHAYPRFPQPQVYPGFPRFPESPQPQPQPEPQQQQQPLRQMHREIHRVSPYNKVSSGLKRKMEDFSPSSSSSPDSHHTLPSFKEWLESQKKTIHVDVVPTSTILPLEKVVSPAKVVSSVTARNNDVYDDNSSDEDDDDDSDRKELAENQSALSSFNFSNLFIPSKVTAQPIKPLIENHLTNNPFSCLNGPLETFLKKQEVDDKSKSLKLNNFLKVKPINVPVVDMNKNLTSNLSKSFDFETNWPSTFSSKLSQSDASLGSSKLSQSEEIQEDLPVSDDEDENNIIQNYSDSDEDSYSSDDEKEPIHHEDSFNINEAKLSMEDSLDSLIKNSRQIKTGTVLSNKGTAIVETDYGTDSDDEDDCPSTKSSNSTLFNSKLGSPMVVVNPKQD
jgi:hypothetical protein